MKKIAMNTVRSFLKENQKHEMCVLTLKVEDSTFDVHIQTDVSISEKSIFINRVLSGCFDIIGNFRPEYAEPMFRTTILQMFTDLPIFALKGEQDENGSGLLDIESMNALYLAMKLDELDNQSFRQMVAELKELCEKAIEWRKACALSERNSADKDVIESFAQAANAVNTLMQTLVDKANGLNMDELMQYAGRLSKVTEGLNETSISDSIVALYKQEKDKE